MEASLLVSPWHWPPLRHERKTLVRAAGRFSGFPLPTCLRKLAYPMRWDWNVFLALLPTSCFSPGQFGSKTRSGLRKKLRRRAAFRRSFWNFGVIRQSSILLPPGASITGPAGRASRFSSFVIPQRPKQPRPSPASSSPLLRPLCGKRLSAGSPALSAHRPSLLT